MVIIVPVPNSAKTVTPDQVEELNRSLSRMRHEINNQLALVVAALELIRFRPEMGEKMLATIAQQIPKVTGELTKYSTEFEQFFGITRD